MMITVEIPLGPFFGCAECDITFSYSPAEKETTLEPGWAAMVDVEKIESNGKELHLEVVDKDALNQLILEQMNNE